MNYAYPTKSSFCAKEDIRNKGKISDEVKECRKFLRSHNFFIEEDKDGTLRLIAKKKE